MPNIQNFTESNNQFCQVFVAALSVFVKCDFSIYFSLCDDLGNASSTDVIRRHIPHGHTFFINVDKTLNQALWKKLIFFLQVFASLEYIHQWIGIFLLVYIA